MSRTLLFALLFLIGNAVARDEPVRVYLDETSAATVTVMREPFIFARERGDLAVNARDYLSLAACEVNQSGKRRLYWFGYFWSTIDRREWEPDFGESNAAVLLADGRPVALRAAGKAPRELGIVTLPLRRPMKRAQAVMFVTDREVLDYIGAARELSGQILLAGHNEALTVWQDARRELRDFLEHLSH